MIVWSWKKEIGLGYSLVEKIVQMGGGGGGALNNVGCTGMCRTTGFTFSSPNVYNWTGYHFGLGL